MTDPASDESALERVERAMVRIRRRQVRRALAPPDSPVDHSVVGVLDAIEAARGSTESVTVGTVAANLGVDPSQGSRLVQAAIEAGVVRREASQEDGRRSILELTEFGREVAERIHSTRHAAFQQAMSGWTSEDMSRFADLLERFVDNLDAIDR